MLVELEVAVDRPSHVLLLGVRDEDQTPQSAPNRYRCVSCEFGGCFLRVELSENANATIPELK